MIPPVRATSREDHPRSRGVYAVNLAAADTAHGSSPLARGLPRRRPGMSGTPRIIPARAGFTGPRSQWCARTADHPRSRGVYPLTFTDMGLNLGSSPLARGLRRLVPRPPRRPWIIPARAGFTSRRSPAWAAPGDHPRSRGVYALAWDEAAWAAGSSPLARGLRAAPVTRGLRAGIIPARAGFTGRRAAIRRRPGDHPRSRGVYGDIWDVRECHHGSSPLARGLRSRIRCGSGRVGIIPARAGFT